MMRRSKPLLVLSALVALAGSWTLAPTPASATAVEWGQAHAQWQAADKRLNETYQRLMAQLGPAARQHLVKAELAWIAFRDAEVQFHEDRMRGGSGASTLGEQTKAHLTVRRADALHDLMVDWGVKSGATAKPSRADIATALANARSSAVAADKTLNQHYKLVIGAIDAPARKLLIQSQLKWITFRDLEAKLWGAVVPHSPFAAADYQDGVAYATTQRAEDLKMLLDLWRSRQ
jgi:uncharacterized protein YecT (DUF1311 family)